MIDQEQALKTILRLNEEMKNGQHEGIVEDWVHEQTLLEKRNVRDARVDTALRYIRKQRESYARRKK